MPRAKTKKEPTEPAAEAQPIEAAPVSHVDRISEPRKEPMAWKDTVRGWTSHGAAGVEHVTTTSPDMVGVRFRKGMERTPEEKREMEEIGLKFISDAQSWLKTNKDGAFDETKDMASRFAARRKQEIAEGSQR